MTTRTSFGYAKGIEKSGRKMQVRGRWAGREKGEKAEEVAGKRGIGKGRQRMENRKVLLNME